MAKLLLSDYSQGITEIQSESCKTFIGYFNVRLITQRKPVTDTFEVEVIDDLAGSDANAVAAASVTLKLRRMDLYLVSFKPARGKEVDLDAIGHTNYNNMTKPSKITLSSVRTAIRTLRGWRNSKEPGDALGDGNFKDVDRTMTGSSAIFTICSLVSEAARFSSVRRSMIVVLENPEHELAVTDPYLAKIQCWSGASDAYFQYLMVQDSLKIVSDPKKAPPLPAPPTAKPPKLEAVAPPPPPPEPMLGEQLMKDIVIAKLPSVKDKPDAWQVWAAEKFAAYW